MEHLIFAFLFAPIVVIVLYSFNNGRLLAAFTDSGSTVHRAGAKSVLSDAVLVSIRTGAIAAVLATLLGTLAGIALARKPGKWTYWFIGLLLLVSVTPEIVDAVSLLPWLVFLGQDLGMSIFNDGTVRLVIGHSLFSVAVVTYIVRARLVGSAREPRRGIRRPLRDAAHDVPPRDAAAGDARRARRRPARVHVQPRQHHRVVVRAGVGHDAVARLRAELAAHRPSARDRRGLDDHARAHARRARRRRPGAQARGRLGHRHRAHAWPAADAPPRLPPPLEGVHDMPHADLVFTGGPVFTADTVRSRATAVAVTGGRIVAVGGDDVRDLVGPGTEVVDLAGRMLRARASRTRTCTRSRAAST